MQEKPFSVTGKTYVIAGATTAPLGIQVPEEGTTNGIQIRIHNAGDVMAFLAVGTSAAAAQANALVPSSGTPRNVVVIPAGVIEVLSFPVGSFFSAVTASGSADVYLCAGKGV